MAKNPKIGNTEKKANGLEEKRINLPKKMLSITVIIRIVRSKMVKYHVNKYIVFNFNVKKPSYGKKFVTMYSELIL